MTWQAEAGRWLPMPGGDFIGPAADGVYLWRDPTVELTDRGRSRS